MKTFRNYSPPSTDDLAALKNQLQLTGHEMADLAALADGRQWRKYTGGATPREMSASMLFYVAARLELDDATVERVLERMKQIGAEFEFIESSTEG